MAWGSDCASDQRPWHALRPSEVRRLIWEGATIVHQARDVDAVGWMNGRVRLHPSSNADDISAILKDRDAILLCLGPRHKDVRPLARALVIQGYRFVFTLQGCGDAQSPRL